MSAWLVGLAAASALLAAAAASADDAPPPGTQRPGTPTPGATAGLTTAGPTPGPTPGPAIEFFFPPPDAAPEPAACSYRRPICVHAPAGSLPSRALDVLSASERAWDILTGALALPPPDLDLDGAWNVYVTRDVAAGGDALPTGRDPVAHYDRVTTFGRIDRAVAPGCALDIAAARALARASLWRQAPATDEGSARAQTEALVRLAVSCGADERDRLEFQRHPERTIADAVSASFDRGASLFFEWLDARFARQPGSLVCGLWALAPTSTPPGASHWTRSPNGYDVLRVSLKGALFEGSNLDDLFVRFAVERARTAPEARVAWHVAWPAKARRLASPEPVSPTGASYVLVDHAGAPAGAKLRVEAQWEDYGRMRWVVIKLDAAGKPIAELPITSLDRGTQASLTVESIDTVDRLLVVGVNVGSTEHAFDPDQGEWEAHGWLLTLSSE